MRWSLPPSTEIHRLRGKPATRPGERLDAGPVREMQQRMIEALRRAEVISLINSAPDEPRLGLSLAEELCEAYEAEIGVVASFDGDGGAHAIGIVGAGGDQKRLILEAPELEKAAGSSRALRLGGADLLGVGGRSLLLAGYRAGGGRSVVAGVIRLYPDDFGDAERALLESVTVSAGQALERLWARRERDELIEQLKEAFVGTAAALSNALEARDDYTAGHTGEVADLAVRLGGELGLDGQALEDLRYGGAFHDIGKIAIPDAILHKPGPLNEAEWEVMVRHPAIGAEILEPITFLSPAVTEMVRHDHERFDGHGYPCGLAGEAIPLGARILFVVDSYHAMTSDRPYRRALSASAAIAELERNAGTQFDPEIVAAFVGLLQREAREPALQRWQPGHQ